MAVKKGAVVIDTKLNHEKINQEFKNLEKTTQSLINKYNKSVDSIKSQELAIQKVKDEIANLQLYADTDLIKANEVKKLDELTSRLPILESKLSQTKTEARQTAKAIEDAFDKQSDIRQLGNGIKDVGNKIEKVGSRITKTMISIAIFDVAREGLRKFRDGLINALKTNDTFNSNLKQIKANLMTAFAPIYNAILPSVNSLMNALKQLTGTFAVFISGLFGQSIEDSAEQAENLAKSLEDVDKSGSKATGSLASFDKLEVVSETGGASTAGGTGINYTSEIEYSQKLLNFLNKIKSFVVENGDYIISFITGTAAALFLLKLGLSGIKALGIGVAIAGLVLLIQSIISYINDPSWENFGKILQAIGLIVIGLGAAFFGLPTALVGAAILIVGIIASKWEEIKGIGLKAVQWIEDHIDEIGDKFGIVGQFIAGVIQGTIQGAIGFFEDFFGGVKRVVDGIIKIFKGDFKGGLEDIFGGLKSILLAPLNLLISGVNSLINGFNKIQWEVPDWVPIIGGKSIGFKIPKIPKLASGAVIPPRQEFVAMLGDQRHGTNIEAPLETIKQANREVLTEFIDQFGGLSSAEKEIVLRNLTFVIQFGNKQFQKVVIDSIRAKENETGKPLLVN